MTERIYWPDKDPDEILDFGFDWSTTLGTDAISTSTWIITGPDSLLLNNSNSFTTATTTIWLKNGTAGGIYEITNRITTSGTRTYDQTAVVLIKEN